MLLKPTDPKGTTGEFATVQDFFLQLSISEAEKGGKVLENIFKSKNEEKTDLHETKPGSYWMFELSN